MYSQNICLDRNKWCILLKEYLFVSNTTRTNDFKTILTFRPSAMIMVEITGCQCVSLKMSFLLFSYIHTVFMMNFYSLVIVNEKKYILCV
jgi:hypothetical protein